MDAIRDLDDCLCHMFLFAALPSDDNIQSKEVKESKRLGCEFENYVISSKSLRKVFLSIRGIYYQAEIKGELITWLVPYQFLQNVPIGVDFRVMLTFLEFYQTLLGFVNFKLYSELNLKYPPMSHQQLEDDGADLLTSFKVESTNSENASTLTSSPNLVPATKLSKLERKTLQQRIHTLNDKLSAIKEDALIEDASSAPHSEETELVVEEEGIATVVDVFEENLDKNVQSTHEKILSQISEKENLTAFQNLFATSVIFLSREVPHHALTFCIQSFGGLMAWSETSGAGSPFKESDAAITHQIVDKPLESLSMIAGRVYIQPQWIFDSINKRQLQPAHLYAPGSILPSHLSPFASYAEDDYVPEEENIEVETDNQLVDEPTEEDPQVNQAELEAEAAGTPFSQYKPILSEESKKAKILTTNGPAVTKRRHRQKELEKIEMHRGLLSNKKRRVVDAFIAEKRGKIREVCGFRIGAVTHRGIPRPTNFKNAKIDQSPPPPPLTHKVILLINFILTASCRLMFA